MNVNAFDLVATQPQLSGHHGGGKAQRKEASDVDNLVSDFGFL